MAVLDPQIVAYVLDGLWLVWLGYWIYKSFGNKRSVYSQGRGVRLIYLGVLVLAYYLAEKRGVMPRVRLFHENIVTQVVGILICAGGIGLAIWARVILATNWSGMVTLKENHELIQSGPYRFVRHPIYSGILLGIFGTVLALNPFLGGVVVMGIAVVSLRLKSLLEERIMLSTFPDQYPEYMRRVRALIPGVW